MISAILLSVVAAAAVSPCASCHEPQASAWASSLHAAAATDPLYLAMREWARSEAGEQAAARCATCHTVPIRGQGTRAAGVTCEACHQGAAQSAGPNGWEIAADQPVSAARAADAPHPIVLDPDLVSGRTCLVCHAELHNAAGVPLCTTGPESEGSGVGCIGCHMNDGHRFDGTGPATLSRAASLTIDRAGDAARITVINRGAGHALPTGSAMRQIRLEVTFRDAAGRRISDNAKDPAATFARLLRDEEGQAPVPPWRAKAIASDTRLAAGERRAFVYPVPRGTAEIDARLVYHRAPPPVIARLGLSDWPLAAPVTMTLARAPLE